MYPDARRIEIIDSGYDNIVGLVDGQFAIRFPRSEAALKRDEFEADVFAKLGKLSALQIPRLLDRRDSPFCFVTTQLPGFHVGIDTIRAWPFELQIEFGIKIGRFAFELHTMLSADEVLHLRQKNNLHDYEDATWTDYLQRTLMGQLLP